MLYSDRNTVGKLAELCESVAEDYKFGHFDDLKDGDTVCYILDNEIHDIKYRDLFSITQKIKRRVKARKRLEERLLRNGEDTTKLGEPVSTSSKRDKFVDGLSSADLRHLKDISFKHEEEIRVHIPIHEYILDQHTLDSMNKTEKMAKRKKPFSHINEKLPERLFVKTPEDFISSIAVDPRAPCYKKKFIEDYFHNLDVQVKQSKCFKSAISYIDIYPFEINPMV